MTNAASADDAVSGHSILDRPGVRAVREALRAAGVAGEVRALEATAPTAAAAAEQLGCAVGAIANSLVFEADGEPLLVLTSGAHRVNTAALASRIGVGAIKRASADFVRAATGQAIGGVAPLGHPAPVRTLVDEALAAYEVVWAAAGHHQTVFPTTFDELVAATRGVAVDVE
jgi:prolyl-tRNA editing enzyme YbaK/EbsC (Cys-tRNA(Pro) deacylase)